MQYEPVGYIIEYEISAFVFLIVIMVRYFGARRFPNQKNRLFALILWVVAIDMVLDIVSSVIIDNVFLVPLPVTYIVNAAFYSLQLLLPLFMTVYTLAMVDYLDRKRILKWLPLLLPGLLAVLLLFFNPLTHWFFFVDPVFGYLHGPMFLFLYFVCVFYMIVTFLVAFRNRGALRKNEFNTICAFLGIVLVSMLIQYLYPALLISGVAIALSVILMYFTIQNPETMLDATTNAFTYEAMLTFLHDRVQERARVHLVAVKIYNMPRINELLGIKNGSMLLRQVCQCMRESAHDSWVFRMRGSSFVAITRSGDDYRALCTRLNERIIAPWTVGDAEILLQATICCVPAEELLSDPVSPEALVNYLETAFLQNERSSNLQNITVGTELLNQIKRSRAVERALREALANGDGLELHFQPIWSVRERRFTSAEALLRFQHPILGSISPDEFVPIAESNGLVTALDELVLRKACAFIRDNRHFADLGLRGIEVNLSALEFMHLKLPSLINGITSEYAVQPSFLCFEITETAATESFAALSACMQTLRKDGYQFALDDFGTGYANISQVIQLPFSMVKLDRTLLYGPPVVLEDMARMFARMQRRTVVEGVETAAQAMLTQSIEVDYLQGYYYAKPMSQQDFLCFLHKNAQPRICELG